MKIIKRCFTLHEYHIDWLQGLVNEGYGRNLSAALRRAIEEAWKQNAIEKGVFDEKKYVNTVAGREIL